MRTTINHNIEHLIINSQKFREKYFSNSKESLHYKKLVEEGQSPEIMLIACCDSRSNPTDILGMTPGEAFIVRTIANLIPVCNDNSHPDATAAGLEFGVEILKVKHIILMGHSKCGGIQALINNASDSSALQKHSFILNWINVAKKTVESTALDTTIAPEEKAKICEENSLLSSLSNLQTYPWIKEKVEAGTLALHVWRFDLKTGKIHAYDSQSKKFEELPAIANGNHPPRLASKL